MLRRPSTVWPDARPEKSQSSLLLMTNSLVASLLGTLALIPGPQWNPRVGYVIAFCACFYTLVIFLTIVEMIGVRLFVRRNGWARARPYESAIMGHASYAWLLSGAGVATSSQVLQHIGPTRLSQAMSPLGISGTTAAIAFIGASFALGMAAFSLLSGFGFRALRFANRPTS
jgi:hypothetical protein